MNSTQDKLAGERTQHDWQIIDNGDATKARPAIIVGKYLRIIVDHGENFGDPMPDARLIAAAPELLAICKEIADAGSQCDLGDSELRIRLYSAITKAAAL